MKKWTVMLIPHDRGESRTLNLSAYQLWLVVCLLVGLSFTTSFFFKRHQVYVSEVQRLKQVKLDLQTQCAKQAANLDQNSNAAQERQELEKRIRAEYEASLAKISADLSDLYDSEAQFRSQTGLNPRTTLKEIKLMPVEPGKGGGGGGSLSDMAYEQGDIVIRPPQVIYGLSHPSADMIVQEINIRKTSLRELVVDLKARQEMIARLPSIWPVVGGGSKISSPFGWRKDPWGLHVRHHEGTDISADTGATVISTAKGTVVWAGYDGDMGNIVRIDHGNGIQTWYAHLSFINVTEGQVVDRRNVVGRVGSTGRSTGPHLHYEVHVNGIPVDSAKYLRD